MGMKILLTGLVLLAMGIVVRKLADDDVAKVPYIVKVFVIGAVINGLAAVGAGALMHIWT